MKKSISDGQVASSMVILQNRKSSYMAILQYRKCTYTSSQMPISLNQIEMWHKRTDGDGKEFNQSTRPIFSSYTIPAYKYLNNE